MELATTDPLPTRLDHATAAPAGWWLFSAPVDLSVFLGSAIAALLALWVGSFFGLLDQETPDWAWVPAILLIDVAHVYSTAFRTYFDPEELRRRPGLYALVPVIGLLFGMTLYSEGPLIFWRVLAYLAVFHFVRQQYGWVALYRARLGESGRLGWWIDASAIYLSTIYPLVYWHAHLPRNFLWFLDNDFAEIPAVTARVLEPIYWAALGIYAVRSLYHWRVGRPNPGKDIVVATTAVCWHVGIITFDSDYAFTVTNVIIHGVPYMALVYWYAYVRPARLCSDTGENSKREGEAPAEPRVSRTSRLGGSLALPGGSRFRTGPSSSGPRERQQPPRRTFRSHWRTLAIFLAVVWGLAFTEELFWDRTLWRERSWLFGRAWDIGGLGFVLVPLLALPQLTHYLLDGFIWRRRSNPQFSLVGPTTSDPHQKTS